MSQAWMRRPSGEIYCVAGTIQNVAAQVANAQATGVAQMTSYDVPEIPLLVRQYQPPPMGLPLLNVAQPHQEEPLLMPTMNYGNEAPIINVPPRQPEQPTANAGGETPLLMPPSFTPVVNATAARQATPAAPTGNAGETGEETPLLMPTMQFN